MDTSCKNGPAPRPGNPSRLISVLIRAAIAVLGLAGLIAAPASAGPPPAGLSPAEIDQIAEQGLDRFNVTGAAVGIVKDGEIVLLRGYGWRDRAAQKPVDENTIFNIASNSKAFTAAALGILVDEGTLAWDMRVREILPDFRLYDDYATQEMTIRDLLTHRSGLGVGAGDLMLWPQPNKFTRTDIVHGLRYFKPQRSFRSGYAYDNTLYIVAGEVIAAASGKPYEEFVDNRLMKPLGLRTCFAGKMSRNALRNVALPYTVDAEPKVIDRAKITNEPIASVAAGGLRCSARDMIVWMQTQLAGGLAPNGQQIFSQQQRDEMWRPQTIMTVPPSLAERNKTHFRAYGLGWRLADRRGYKEVSHTGTLAGMRSYVTLIPELDLGVVILSNGESSYLRKALMDSIINAYLGAPHEDWVAVYAKEAEEFATAHREEKQLGTACPAPSHRPDTDYEGIYDDPWFGAVEIRHDGLGYTIQSQKSPRLVGPLTPCKTPNVFVVRWTDRTLADGDAFVQFETDFDGAITGMLMARVDPAADWSFDFQDLAFTRRSTDGTPR
ncbi:MAG: serine hydrolase [Parvularcula sp.]